MKKSSATRYGLVLGGLVLASSLSLEAQVPVKPSAAVSALPVSQTTSAVATNTPVAAAPVQVRHVQVDYANGSLAVDATNASLNEILREVSKKTGIKITGSAGDDRVFGHYGPSKPAVVLDALLDGTGSNMLLVDDANGKSELILTARRGGVSPPSANASSQQNEPDDDAGTSQYVAPTRPYQPPTPNGRSVAFPQSGQDGAAPAAGDATDGPRTPQQIYDQLQRQTQKQLQTPPQQ